MARPSYRGAERESTTERRNWAVAGCGHPTATPRGRRGGACLRPTALRFQIRRPRRQSRNRCQAAWAASLDVACNPRVRRAPFRADVCRVTGDRPRGPAPASLRSPLRHEVCGPVIVPIGGPMVEILLGGAFWIILAVPVALIAGRTLSRCDRVSS